ncbi:MAG: hypothetical protein WC939_06180 [Acholeplasmataceae bacterium]
MHRIMRNHNQSFLKTDMANTDTIPIEGFTTSSKQLVSVIITIIILGFIVYILMNMIDGDSSPTPMVKEPSMYIPPPVYSPPPVRPTILPPRLKEKQQPVSGGELDFVF